VAAFDELWKRFGDDSNPAIQEIVGRGLNFQSASLSALGRELQDRSLLERAIMTARRAVSLGADCYDLACVLALAGEKDEAFELLERSLSENQISWEHVAQDRDWEALREDPRYKGLEGKYAENPGKTEHQAEAPLE